MIVFALLESFYIGKSDNAKVSVMSRNKEVLAASDVARKHGVVPGIAIRLARRRCHGLEIKEFRPETYAERFDSTWSIFASYSPMVETRDFHQGYIDITSDVKRFGGAEQMMEALSYELDSHAGIKLVWGGGADKWMAWLARGHNQFITPAMESLVLSKLPVESMALPERVTERLHHFDIHTVAQVTALPSGFLESHLGFDRNFVLKFLTRHKEPVQPNFPLRKIEARVDITESDEQACQRAIAEVARAIVTQLADTSVQSSCLRITYETKARRFELDHRLSQGVLTEGRLTKILFDLLPDNMQRNLKNISVEARGLLPRQVTQDLLWEKSLTNNAVEQLERAQNKLHTRYGVD